MSKAKIKKEKEINVSIPKSFNVLYYECPHCGKLIFQVNKDQLEVLKRWKKQ